MKKDELFEAIVQRIEGRFAFDELKIISLELEQIAPEEILNRSVVRLKRMEAKSYKTILVSELDSEGELQFAIEWAALAKELLVDPETADLYLFICFSNQPNVNIETCIRVESTEQFCRKYVIHPNESADEFLDRTFLAKIESTSRANIVSDPVLNAFKDIEKTYAWFTEDEQKKWLKTFLSGLSGPEIVDKIFNQE